MEGVEILLVDDDPLILDVLKKHLTLRDWIVSTAHDGLVGLERLQCGRIKLAIVDINMPIMDGITLLKKIQSRNIKIPIVILTGYGSIEAAVECVKLGAIDFIQKPIVNYDDFCNKIKLHLLNRPTWEQKINNLLEIHYANANFRLEDLARLVNCSKSQLSIIFRKHLDKTFTERLLEIRLEKALELIEVTNLTFSEIAVHCGFNSLAYLSRLFKKRFGSNMRDWRDDLLNNSNN